MTRNLNAQRLRELLAYDPQSGEFRWNDIRPLNRAAGVAGRTTPDGYRSIKVDGHEYLAHRLAWLYVHGVWPKEFLDHKNRVRGDNAIANLREATKSQNGQNTGLSRRNKSGHRGVSWNAQMQKWNAKIGHQGRKRHLGFFADLSEAVAAYAVASRELHEFGGQP